MDRHALLMYTVMRNQHPGSPELARRRENLARFEREAREARGRRRSEVIRRSLTALRPFHGNGLNARVQRCEDPAVGEALR